MTEDFLHYLWQYGNFQHKDLTTACGKPVAIIALGVKNHNAGPDFLQSKLRIGDQIWAGSVEIHINSSDWRKHNHSTDEAYKSVVLHVVYNHDEDVFLNEKEALPVLSLKGLFDEMLYWRYEQLLTGKKLIPCQNHLQRIDPMHIEMVYDRTLIERFEDHFIRIKMHHEDTAGDWNDIMMRELFRAFGLKVNTEPMLQLASRLTHKNIARMGGEVFQLEALLLGAAGFLEAPPEDAYTHRLKAEFDHLKNKFNLEPLPVVIWKFFRLRPPSFPPLRLAQLASLLARHPNLFSTLSGIGNMEVLKKALEPEVSEYWQTHYQLGKSSAKPTKGAGAGFLDRTLINAIAPTVMAYGKFKGEPFYEQRALDWLDQMKPEKNSVVDELKKLGFPMKSAYHTQAALQLKKYHCDLRKCLSCAIGIQIIEKGL